MNDKTLEIGCRIYGLTSDNLKKIINYRIRGFNNTEIAEKIGISRQTIQRYTRIMKNMPENDVIKIIKLIFGGEKDVDK